MLPPCSSLPLIEQWATDGPATSGIILPDGCMDLVTDGETIVVAGADTRARHFAGADNGCPMWGVRFHPGLLPGLLDIPASSVTDQVVPLEDLTRTRVNPQDLHDIKHLMTVFPAGAVEPTSIKIAGQLWRGDSIEQVAQSASWSPRQLRRLSMRWFGYGPKHLQRVLRMRRAEQLLSNGLRKSDVAAWCGYADSSHLWRDRRDLNIPAS